MPTINGTDGDDVINETGNSDSIFGLGGNDRIICSFGIDIVDGGAGSDTLVFINNNAFATQMTLSGTVSYSGTINNAGGDAVSFSAIERFEITTGSANDVLVTGDGNDIIQAGGGDDDINVGRGFDTADGASGIDRITADLSDQAAGLTLTLSSGTVTGTGFSFTGFERWNLKATPFDDTITLGVIGSQSVNGGNGNDALIVSYANSFSTTVNLSGGASYSGSIVNAGGDNVSFSSIERFQITTGSGNDVIRTGNGNDVIQAGAGDDQVEVGMGFDSVNGGDGFDRLIADLSSQAAGLSLDLRSSSLTGPGFFFTNFERWNITATPFDDTITVGAFDYTVAGGDGHDTLIVIHTSSSATQINLSGSGSYSGSITNPVGDIVNFTSIERFEISTGSANEDLRTGNGNDVIRSGAGNDIVDGAAGADQMYGGTGEDTYLVDNEGDAVFELAGEGTSDRVIASASFALAANSEVEFLQTPDEFDTPNIDLTGSDTANIITGNNGNNILRGGAGNDELYGYGGDDILVPGAGDDRVHGLGGSDTVSYEDAAAGVTVNLSITVAQNTIGAGTDRIEFVLNLTGSALADILSGNAGPNILRGLGGGDTLNGLDGGDFLVGGAGSDIMVGGLGDDTYYIDDTSDAIGEQAGQGNDRVAARITLALAADADIERLDVENLTSTDALDLTGSGIANTIYGNDGVNILRGEAGNDELRGFGGDDFLVGGTGTDLMVGGLGDDTFYVDDASDAIGEIAGQGNDRIAASVSFVLSNGANVELLEAVNLTATTAFDLTGSDSANTITGNNGVNILRGEGGNDILSSAGGDDFLVGGAGVDGMTGGAGNDTYYVDDAADAVFEIAGEGSNDRVAASVSYTLAANADVERLEADPQSGNVTLNLTGSNIGNALLGNEGANVLDGRGGSDVLTGLGGADTYAFTTALGAANVDVIVGFASGSDKVALDDAIFAAIGPVGALAAGAFKAGNAATEADDRIIYNQATGQLFYDADGDGAGAAVLFATLTGNPALAASDFQVI